MNLSPHFSIEEFIFSQNKNIDNFPPAKVISELQRLANFLEIVRVHLVDHPIIITSGYRSPELNASVGGVSNSQHLLGQAADFICPKFGTPSEICLQLMREFVEYDQLIDEDTRVHISIPVLNEMPRCQSLTLLPDGTYEKGFTS